MKWHVLLLEDMRGASRTTCINTSPSLRIGLFFSTLLSDSLFQNMRSRGSCPRVFLEVHTP
jgi:hypothetical protein